MHETGNPHSHSPIPRGAASRTDVHLFWILFFTLIFSIESAIGADRVLSTSSPEGPRSIAGPILDIARAGDRLVSVGERGHIVYSNDSGESWHMASVPVDVTLTAVHFVDEAYGWAVGHQGVVLSTTDGGLHWTLGLDGDRANQLIVRAIEAEVNASAGEVSESLEWQLADAQSFEDEGATRPFLDVWFKNRAEGLVVGAYGMILKTSDGGQSWRAMTLRMDNPSLFHLNRISEIGHQLFIAGEAGSLFASTDDGESWETIFTPYDGTFFGISRLGQSGLLAYGLRGNVFIKGSPEESWEKLETGFSHSLFGTVEETSDGLTLLGNSGVVLRVSKDGKLTSVAQTDTKAPLVAGLTVEHGKAILVGSQGIQITGGH